MTREELAQEIEEFLAYIDTIKKADEFNVTMTHTVLSGFAAWLTRKSE